MNEGKQVPHLLHDGACLVLWQPLLAVHEEGTQVLARQVGQDAVHVALVLWQNNTKKCR
jgi:hypothetical protein